MKNPAIVLNMKMYDESVGKNGLEIAKICEEVANTTGASIGIAPPLPDTALVAREVDIPVFAQHVDPLTPGGRTGHITPESVKASGAIGSLINHSEHRMLMADMEASITRCNDIGLESIVCTNNLAVSKAAAFVAVEPPELIGGDISVTSADPEIVSSTAKALKELTPNVKVLTGAGVKTSKDVRAAIELGTDGVLLASGVIKAKDPKAVLLDLVSGL